MLCCHVRLWYHGTACLWLYGAYQFLLPNCGSMRHMFLHCLTVVSRGLWIPVAPLWIHGALYNQLDSGFIVLIYLCDLSANLRGSCLLSITGLTVDSQSPGEVLSDSYGVFTKSIIISLVEFIEFLSSVSVLSFLGTAHFYSICYLCFRGWCRFLGRSLHHSYQTARWVLCPWLRLAFLVLKFLLLLFDFHGAQQEGKVLQMYMMLQV
jgi:hypothetical protein